MMGTFESTRMGAKDVFSRWLKAGRALKNEDQVYALKLSEMIKRHSIEGFNIFDDPLEAAMFSIMIELMKELDSGIQGGWSLGESRNGDPISEFNDRYYGRLLEKAWSEVALAFKSAKGL